jgi:putative Mg2+ transporter-C (MgtC) family protein
LDSFQCSVLLRLIFAAICGILIGLERDLKGRPAGLKTFSLVCIGATLSMVTNEYISVYLNGGSGDAARMAAQVISGIGFLGAGTIIVTCMNQIRGLTTAAALWLTAAIGMSKILRNLPNISGVKTTFALLLSWT